MTATGTADVIVVGSGALGASIVWRLAADGRQILWVTGSGNDGSASLAAGAMLAVHCEVSAHQDGGLRDLEVATRGAGRALWDEWLPAVEARAGTTVELVRGVHVVGRGPQDAANLEAIRTSAASFGARCEAVDPADVPGLRPDRGWEPAEAIHLPEEATVDAGRLLDALRSANEACPSVTVVHDDATRVTARGEVVTASGGTLSGAAVVLAAGALSASLLAESGLPGLMPALFGGRGVSLLLRSAEPVPGCIRTPNRSFACGLHLVPRADGLTYLGATNRFTTQPVADAGPSLAELDDLISSGVRELDVRLRRAEVVATFVGHRPVTMDRLPLVGRTQEPAILVATGTWRNGIGMAPVIADLVAEELAEPGATAKHPFAVARRIEPPTLDGAAISRAAEGIAETILGGGTLAAGRNADLVSFLRAALTAELDAPHGDRTVARLLERAPMEEALPLVFDLLTRRRR